MSNEPMIVRARARAPFDQVWRALTDARQLRVWLAEFAEVELPHRFEFWGRFTPEGDAPHQKLQHADDSSLQFSWLLDGVETTTRISAEADGPDATVITLTQSHFDYAEAIAGTNVRGVLQTFWYLSIGNLVDHVEGRTTTPLTDFTIPELKAVLEIAAPAERVYEALTVSEQVTTWFGYPIEVEPEVGGRFAMGGFDNNPDPARITAVDPGRSVTIDWGPMGVTNWELEESDGKTRLTFVQSGFDLDNPPYAAWTGTVSGFAGLRRYLEQPGRPSIWLEG
jgi:uncharacterized protein YndB with AHSA1/START domain